MIKDRELNFNDYVTILRRRKFEVLLPLLVLPLAAYLISLSIPSRYTSRALILIAQQQVPDEFVKPVITAELNGRLIHMQQQVFSRTRLQPLIDKFGLYRDDRDRVPMEELVDRLRQTIVVTPVRSDITSKAAGIPGFTIYFTTDEPVLAQQICGQIVSMFLEENLKGREQQAEATTDFLTKQLEEGKRKLDEQDAKLAEFKRHSIGQLPGQEQSNFGLLSSLISQLDAVTSALGRAQQDKTYVESFLAQQLASWKSTREDANPYDIQQQLQQANTRLAELQGRYTSDHPDVLKEKKQIAELRRKLDSTAQTASTEPTEVERADNTEPPQIQQLRAALHQHNATIQQKTSEQERLQQQVQVVQSRLQLSPSVEEQYKVLTRDYQAALEFYNTLLNKRNLSQMATDLERRQQGEQFQVMDPPDRPEKPTFPNRLYFSGGGLVAGLVFGLFLAFVIERKDDTFRSESDVEVYLKLPTLALFPIVGNESSNGFGKFWTRRKKQGSKTDESVRIS